MIASAWYIVATTDIAVTLLYYLSHIYNFSYIHFFPNNNKNKL